MSRMYFIIRRSAVHLYSIFQFKERITNIQSKFLKYLLVNKASDTVAAEELSLQVHK